MSRLGRDVPRVRWFGPQESFLHLLAHSCATVIALGPLPCEMSGTEDPEVGPFLGEYAPLPVEWGPVDVRSLLSKNWIKMCSYVR